MLANAYDSGPERPKDYLVDLASDGMPILVTMHVWGDEIWGPNSSEPMFWQYENGTAVEYDFLEDFYREGTGEYCAVDSYSIETLDEGTVWVVHGSTGADYGRWVYYRMDGGRLIPAHVEECYYYDFNGVWLDGVNYDSHEAVLQELGAAAGEYDGDFSAYSNYYSSFCVMEYARELMVSVPNEGSASALRSELLQYVAALGDSGSQTADSSTDVDPLELLGGISYVGNLDNCKLTGAQASAFADVLANACAAAESAASDFGGTPYCRAALFDAGNGVPAMIVCAVTAEEWATHEFFADDLAVNYGSYFLNVYSSVNVWTWNGRTAVRWEYGDYTDYFNIHEDGINIGARDGGEYTPITYAHYPFDNGTIETTADYFRSAIHWFVGQTGDTPPTQAELDAYLQSMLENTISWLPGLELDYSTLSQDEWQNYLDMMWSAYVVDGEFLPYDEFEVDTVYWQRLPLLSAYFDNVEPILNLDGRWDTGASLESTLRAYAAAYTGYSYPRAETVDEAALVEAIAAAVAEAVGGEVTAIYKLADGVYYVIITVNGVEKGAVVTGGKTNGEIRWNVDEVHDEPLTQEELDEVTRGLTSMMNVELDYNKVQTGDPDDAYEALEEALETMPGVTPNDPAKNAIVEYIQSAISSNYSLVVPSCDNRFVLNAQTVETLAEQARQEKQRYDELLQSHGVTLNKPITIIIRILWNDMDAGVPCQVTLDETLLEALSGCTAQLLLGDAQHYLQISAENLETLIAAYGTVHVQLARESEGCYVINFLDENEQLIERLETPVTIALPAPTELSTIMVYYEDGSANWGGQYDPNARLLSFDASYTGRYEVFDNSVQIDDIEQLDDQTKQAISFLAANGYMDVADGSFRPDEPLTRYEFAQAMVGMFFALDSSQQTSFTDVPADSPYYVYVASGEALNLINGFSDGTFGGDLNISKQQLLALTARTLIERKGYSEPTNPNEYLRSFKDAQDVGDWARSQVALSVREELVDRGGYLNPQGDVTRSEAALILYRLFLLLHEVPAVQLELPEVTEEPEIPADETADPEAPTVEETPAEETAELEELDGADQKGSVEKKDAGKLVTVVAASAAGCAVVFGGGGVGLWWLLKKRKLK